MDWRKMASINCARANRDFEMMPPWLKEIEDGLALYGKSCGAPEGLHPEPLEQWVAFINRAHNMKRLLELAMRAIEMAEFYGKRHWVSEGIYPTPDKAREFLEWVKEGK